MHRSLLGLMLVLAAGFPGLVQAQALAADKESAWPSARSAGLDAPLDAHHGLPADGSQPAPQPPAPYTPITGAERIRWIVDGTVGVRSLAVVGVLSATWQTGWNTPEEWGQSWSGFGKRYLAREADVALSNSIEAGLGAIWGEEPRYIPAPRGPVRSRIVYAMKTVLLAQRRDGHLAPAWARYAGNTINNVIENAYLPPSVTTASQTVLRSANGFVGRLLGNLWEEFWPDVHRRLRRR